MDNSIIDKRYSIFVRNYLLSSSLYDFVFAYAVYNVFFRMNGLTVWQISLLISWWALTAMLFEIPSGALADKWSRKNMLIIAPLIKSICFIIWFFAEGNFYLYAIGFLCWSVSGSLVSGTSEALLYDELIAFNRKEQYKKIISRKYFYLHISIAIATIIGGFIAHYDIDLVFILSILPLYLSSFFAYLIQESSKKQRDIVEVKYLNYIKLAYEEVKTNNKLLKLFIFALGVSIFGTLEEFDQLYYQLVGVPIFAFGLVILLYSLLNALGSYCASSIADKPWVFYVLPFISAVCLLLTGFRPQIIMLILLLFSYFISSPLLILIDNKIQHNINSISRATIISVKEFVINFFGIVLTLTFGLVGKFFGLSFIYVLAAIFLFVLVIWTIRNKKLFN